MTKLRWVNPGGLGTLLVAVRIPPNGVVVKGCKRVSWKSFVVLQPCKWTSKGSKGKGGNDRAQVMARDEKRSALASAQREVWQRAAHLEASQHGRKAQRSSQTCDFEPRVAKGSQQASKSKSSSNNVLSPIQRVGLQKHCAGQHHHR